MKYSFRDELFGNQFFKKSCALAAKYGFGGIEIAPYTLSPNIHEFGAAKRSETKKC